MNRILILATNNNPRMKCSRSSIVFSLVFFYKTIDLSCWLKITVLVRSRKCRRIVTSCGTEDGKDLLSEWVWYGFWNGKGVRVVVGRMQAVGWTEWTMLQRYVCSPHTNERHALRVTFHMADFCINTNSCQEVQPENLLCRQSITRTFHFHNLHTITQQQYQHGHSNDVLPLLRNNKSCCVW